MGRRREKLLLACQRGELNRLREELSDRGLRERCLREAVYAGSGQGWPAEKFISAASEFAAFVTKARPAKRKK